jgi:3D (Asp-Asp-Asp) domain-containing protein/uncharacterized protein YabE (DUF348 family)
LLIPFGAGTFSDRAVALVENAASDPAGKHVTLVQGGKSESLETRAATVDDLLTERGIVRSPGDLLSTDPASAVTDGETITYQPAVPVTLVVDNVARQVRTPASTVAQLLATQNVSVDRHDIVWPRPSAPLSADVPIRVLHVRSWIERIRLAIAPPVRHRFAFDLAPGTTRVVDPGAAGTKELTVAFTRAGLTNTAARRSILALRIVRAPRARVVAEGIGAMTTFAAVAQHGIAGTLRLAGSALNMIATAYTASCAGCSGYTASGVRAGRGVVAVDPRVIPLGTKLYIPGYGTATAGDTGGAIRGNRIDLGFNSNGDAMDFGRRSVTVYVIK